MLLFIYTSNPPHHSLLFTGLYSLLHLSHPYTTLSNMYSTALSAIFALLAIRPALADFKVFCGTDGNALDGVSANECHFFNNPPDCADFENSVSFVIQKDVSFDGVACDGCDISKAPQDWDVTRLEIHEPNYFEGGVDHFSTPSFSCLFHSNLTLVLIITSNLQGRFGLRRIRH